MAILDASHVFLDNPSTTRDELFQFIANKTVELGFAADASGVLKGLNDREAEGSTGMMSGFAIPHCKTAAVSEPCIVVVRPSAGIDWQTMDKAQVSCAIALIMPDGDLGTEHLRTLSKLAVMLMHEDFCAKLKESASAEDIVAAIEEGLEQ